MSTNVHRPLFFMESSQLMSPFKVHRMYLASRINNKQDHEEQKEQLAELYTKKKTKNGSWETILSFSRGGYVSFRKATIT